MSDVGKRIIGKLVDLGRYYNRDLNRTSLEIWADAVSDLDPDAVLAVISGWPASNDWFPKASEVRRVLDPGKAEGTEAIEAWGHVLEYCRSRSPIPENEKTRRAVSVCGGLRAIGHCNEQELGFMQKRFTEAYGANASDTPVLPASVMRRLQGA